MDDFQLLAAGVAGNVQALQPVVDHICALAVELIDDAGDGFFIAGDGGGRDDHVVARLDLHLPVAGKGHAVQGGHILALRAGGNDDEFVLWHGLDLVDVHQRALRDGEIAQLRGDLEDVLHAAPGDGDLAAVAVGDGQHRLDPVHI